MTAVPNELKITINTSIPGFQTIRYKPFMTLPDDKNDNAVQFNPLVKLKPSIIKSLPENVQKREFFNKGLFQSLINSHGLIRDRSLVEATNNGNVDNNIRVTLDTLFPTNSILYINKQPYVIADVQWTKGDWKIDKKIQQFPELESGRITDPYLYRTIVKDEIISGENELQQLPKEIVYGANYTGPVNVAAGVKPPPPPAPAPSPAPSPAPAPAPSPGQRQLVVKPYRPVPNYPPLPPLPPPPPPPSPYIKPYKPTPYPQLPPSTPSYPQLPPSTPTTKPIKPTPYPQLPAPPTTKPIKPLPYPQLPAPSTTKPIKPLPYPQILPPPGSNPFDDDDDDNDDDAETTYDETKLVSSKGSTKLLRDYFKYKDNYYFMVNTIFQNMTEQEKLLINDILKKTSGIDVKTSNNLSKDAYKNTIDNMRVNTNRGGGDCFFIAVADALNYYNSNTKNKSDRIIYNNYGTPNMNYTQKMLRGLVAGYISSPGKYNELFQFYGYLVDELNDDFLNAYEELKQNVLGNNNITQEQFFNLVNDIYHNNENFLIMKPTKMTQQTLVQPFSFINNNKSEITTYIQSPDYWANSVSMDAICENLGLNIIIVETNEEKTKVSYVYNGNKIWSTYMFLYYKDHHYELISFEYVFKTFKKEPKFSIKTERKTYVIFDKMHSNNIYPPFFMIFLIFATYYLTIKDNRNRNQFQLLSQIMQRLYIIYNQIVGNQTIANNKRFIRLFDQYFEPNNNNNNIRGGAPFPYQSYKRNNFYQPYRPPFVSSYTKNNSILDETNPKSNISYYITIDMELKKGTSLSPNELSNLKCRRQWNSVRKSYADLRGLKYSPTPDYNNLPSSKSKPENNKTKTQKGNLGLFSKQSNNNNNNNNNNKTRKLNYLS
jgi:hypothetical protein